MSTPQVVAAFRSQFPLLQEKPKGGLKGKGFAANRLIYLDNAASTPMAAPVIDTMLAYTQDAYSNVHRSLCPMAQDVTNIYEKARVRIASWLHAPSHLSVVFTSGATGALNLAIRGLYPKILKSGDRILLSPIEHHSNIVPWFLIREHLDLSIDWMPLTPRGNIDLDGLRKLLGQHKYRVLSITQMSNVTGTRPPLHEILPLAREHGILTIVDGAQGLPQNPNGVNFKKLGCDLYVATGHKIYGPTGIGFLLGKPEVLERMSPILGGGEMIDEVSLAGAVYADPPRRFEAGTPPIVQAICMGTVADFVKEHVVEELLQHKGKLCQKLEEAVEHLPGCSVLGMGEPRGSVVAIRFKNVIPLDVAVALGSKGICCRVGKLCAHPLFEVMQIPEGVLRLSLGPYNTEEEIDKTVEALERTLKILA